MALQVAQSSGLTSGVGRTAAALPKPAAPAPVKTSSGLALVAGRADPSAQAQGQLGVDRATGVYYRQYNDAVTHQALRQDSAPDVLAESKRLREAAKAQRANRDVQISVDKDTGIYVYRSQDPVTHQAEAQTPPEEILAMAKRLREASVAASPAVVPGRGALVDLLG